MRPGFPRRPAMGSAMQANNAPIVWLPHLDPAAVLIIAAPQMFTDASAVGTRAPAFTRRAADGEHWLIHDGRGPSARRLHGARGRHDACGRCDPVRRRFRCAYGCGAAPLAPRHKPASCAAAGLSIAATASEAQAYSPRARRTACRSFVSRHHTSIVRRNQRFNRTSLEDARCARPDQSVSAAAVWN